MASAQLETLGQTIAAALGEAIVRQDIAFDELTLTTVPGRLIEVVKTLRDAPNLRFISFIDVTAVDHPGRVERFDVVYHLLSPVLNARLRLKVAASETTEIPSLTGLFPGADWFEREAFDLYGIVFTGHPDMRRILTDYGFEGYPLRKDFPPTGYREVRYDDAQKRVVYEPVSLNQEFRKFDFLSPWEGADYPLPGDEKAGEKKDKGA